MNTSQSATDKPPQGAFRDFFSFKVRLSGLVAIATALAAFGTLAGFFGQFAWWLDLCVHFRVQYFLFLAILGVILWIMRRIKTAIACGLLALINLAIIAPFYLTSPDQASPVSPTYRAMLVNVNTEQGDPVKVRQCIQEHDPDFIVMEEISDRWAKELEALRQKYPYRTVETREDNFGIALFSKHPFLQSDIVHLGEAGVPSVYGTVSLRGGTSLSIIGTHPLPPRDREYTHRRNDQLAQLPAFLHHVKGPVLLLGDLNATPWSYSFRKLLREASLQDSSRGRGIHPTWPTFIPVLWIPIDHCLHNAEVVIADRKVGKGVGSDHYPLVVDFAIKTRGRI